MKRVATLRQTGVLSSAFGLRVWSNLPIPGLGPATRAETGIDVRVWLGEMPADIDRETDDPSARLVFPMGEEGGVPDSGPQLWRLRDDYLRLCYSNGTEFLIDRTGSQVWAAWREPMTLEDAATYLLGPVFGFVLRLRGVTCLHASAIAAGGRALVLLGPCGAGKSTTAAAFARSGFPVLSDDVVALEERGDQLLVQPGNPRMRLWPNSARILFGEPDYLPRLTPTWNKRYLDLAEKGRFESRALPLAAVYVLDERRDEPEAPYVRELPPRDGLVTLVANTYVNQLLDPAMRAREFAVLGRIVTGVPQRQVTPHASEAQLPELCRVILEDFRGMVRAPTVREGVRLTPPP